MDMKVIDFKGYFAWCWFIFCWYLGFQFYWEWLMGKLICPYLGHKPEELLRLDDENEFVGTGTFRCERCGKDLRREEEG